MALLKTMLVTKGMYLIVFYSVIKEQLLYKYIRKMTDKSNKYYYFFEDIVKEQLKQQMKIKLDTRY